MRSIRMFYAVLCLPVGCLCLSVGQFSHAQTAQRERPENASLRTAAGDTSDNPGRIDATLSPRIARKDVRRAMKKVADWEVAHSEALFTQDWTYAPLYSGLLAASATTGDPKYHDAVVRYAEKVKWQLLPGRYDHADDEAIGQAYETLYLEKKDPIRIAALRENLDKVVVRQRDPQKDLWWWCDALYMAPSAFVTMSQITGDRKYLAFVDTEWDLTTAHLYVPADKLYFRDATFLQKTEANGQKLFWSRGNGWVLAGLARTLSGMPKDYPHREKYVGLYRDMAERIAALQQPSGLWRTGLLDQASYKDDEISGSAFFTYAMAWGVNHGYLDAKKYRPVIDKSWAAMLGHVFEDGRLGSIQPIGAAPGAFGPGTSYVYGVGAFLLAGSEIDALAKGAKQ